MQDFKQFMLGHIIPHVNALRALQDPSGAIVRDPSHAAQLLNALRAPVREFSNHMGQAPFANAFEKDVDAWLSCGLHTRPAFDNALAAFRAPADGDLAFFVGPVVCTNGPEPKGHFMECFLTLRHEPEILATLMQELPNPNYVGHLCDLITGSDGFMTGDCVVFFPENVATAVKQEEQPFGIYFYNKSQHIFEVETIALVRARVNEQRWVADGLSREACNQALGLWNYLHEYYHTSGPRPLQDHLQLKMNFFVGLLEEVKVDCQSMALVMSRNLPYAYEMAEFVLLERLFRYPQAQEPGRNFDAGTGIFMFEWLRHNGYITVANGKLSLDVPHCIEGLRILGETIQTLERIEDPAMYKSACKAFVRLMLPESTTKGERFALPAAYMQYVGHHPQTTPLSFSEADL